MNKNIKITHTVFAIGNHQIEITREVFDYITVNIEHNGFIVLGDYVINYNHIILIKPISNEEHINT